MAGKLEISMPSDREIAITRVFHAPRRLVFDAWTKPELIQRWLGVRAGWTLPVCEVDARAGGSFRYVWRGPRGEEMGMRATIVEYVPPERIVCAETFDQAWYDGSCRVTTRFEEHAGRTTVTMTLRYDTMAIRDAVLQTPMATGIEEGYQALDRVLGAAPVAR